MHEMQQKPQDDPYPKLSIAELTLVYEPHISIGDFDSDKLVVQNHFNILAQKISARLTNELQGEISIGNIEYTEGSIVVSGRVLAAWLFITPIIQGYITNQLPPIKPLFASETKLKGSVTNENH